MRRTPPLKLDMTGLLPQSTKDRPSEVKVPVPLENGLSLFARIGSFLRGLIAAEVQTAKPMQATPNLVTVFSAACSTYHDWQSVVLHHSWQRSGLPGQLVRVLACTPKARQRYDRFGILGKSMQTYIHDDQAFEAGLSYSPLNKPWGLHSWLTEGDGRKLSNDTVVLIVDPDMVFSSENTLAAIMPLAQHVQLSGEALGLDYRYVRWGMRHNKWKVPLRFLPSERLSHLQSIGPPIAERCVIPVCA
jgi:hypothetical protein